MSTPAVIHSLISFLLIITTAARATQKLQCPGYAYACGPTLDVHFPFGVLQDDRCAYPGFNLSCGTNNASPTLQLPNAGNFTVRGINYLNQQIYISDPAHCFASRLLTFNLSGSPFRAVTESSFVLFKCPPDLRSGFRSVACLSSENFTVIALAASDAEKSAPEGCEEMERVRVPGGWVDYDGLGEGALLQWDWPDCRSCEAADGLCGFKATAGLEVGCSGAPTNGVSTSAKYRLALGLGIPGILCAIALLCCARCKIYCNGPTGHHNHNTALEFSTTQPHVVHAGRGLDQPTIDSYPKTILGQSKRVPKPSADGTCPICLSEYRAKEALRTLPDCNHYFHAHCIDAWLKLNSTCPVCRADTPDRRPSHTTRLIS